MTEIMKTETVERQFTDKYICDKCGKSVKVIDWWPLPNWFKNDYDISDMPGERCSCEIKIEAGWSSGDMGRIIQWHYHLCGECVGDLLNWLAKESRHNMNPTSEVDF
jgi:hypothetical protein